MKEFSQYDLPTSNDSLLKTGENAICVSPLTGEITPALKGADYKWGKQVTIISGYHSVTQPLQGGETFYVYIDAARSITDGSGGGDYIVLPDGNIKMTTIIPVDDDVKVSKKP